MTSGTHQDRKQSTSQAREKITRSTCRPFLTSTTRTIFAGSFKTEVTIVAKFIEFVNYSDKLFGIIYNDPNTIDSDGVILDAKILSPDKSLQTSGFTNQELDALTVGINPPSVPSTVTSPIRVE